jgi:hypothetical protein
MEFDTCHQFLWAHVTKFLKLPTGKHNQKFWHDYTGVYVVSVNESPVFSVDDIDCIVHVSARPLPPLPPFGLSSPWNAGLSTIPVLPLFIFACMTYDISVPYSW